MEGSQFIVLQNSNTMTVGSNSELDRFRLQIGEYCLEAGVHAVLAGTEIHRAHGQTFQHGLHLTQAKTIRASRIAVAKGAREITFVGEPEPQRNSSMRHCRAAR